MKRCIIAYSLAPVRYRAECHTDATRRFRELPIRDLKAAVLCLGPFQLKQRYSLRHEKMRAILKEARLKAGLTQADLCMRLKRERTFVSTVERGTRMLDALELIDYAQGLGTDPVKLFAKFTRF